MKKKNIWTVAIISLFVGVIVGYLIPSITKGPEAFMRFEDKSLGEKRQEWIDEANIIRASTEYRCCIEKPCWYCIQKTPGHGEGASCTCLDDVMAGKHPCGECIGEILEGHGIESLAPYYAKAIAEEVGEQHLDHLKGIISDTYEVSVEEQVS